MGIKIYLKTHCQFIEKQLNFQDQELLDQAEEKIKKNSSNIVPADKADNFTSNANEFWNKFYSIHGNYS